MERKIERGLNVRVNDVDSAILPSTCGGGGSDGDASLLLLLHPIHGGSSLVHLSDLVSLASVVKDTLGCGGFAGIDVSHDSDVPVL